MCGQEPNDGDGIAGRPAADDRVDDRETLAADPAHFVMGQVRGGRVGHADAVFQARQRAVAGTLPSARGSPQPATRSSSSRSQGRDQVGFELLGSLPVGRRGMRGVEGEQVLGLFGLLLPLLRSSGCLRSPAASGT